MPRKHEFEEIEVDLNESEPLSKKQKRLLKKGKLATPEETAQGVKPKAKSDDSLADLIGEEEPRSEPEVDAERVSRRAEFGVWIGNLPFDATAKDLRAHLVKLAGGKIKDEDFTRFKHVSQKGYVYADVKTEEQMNALIALSEEKFLHRFMLIKNAQSFEGRPTKAQNLESKNPPSRILFVGNLTFDTTDDQLRQHFQHCGPITRIRTATFQDSGKCKGFTFIDFESIESATKALKDKSCRKLNGRTLRMEFGEDRSKRRPTIPREQPASSATAKRADKPERAGTREDREEKPVDHKERGEAAPATAPSGPRTGTGTGSSSQRRVRSGPRRPTPGMALSNANRANHAVVESTGKKTTFD